MDLVAQKHVTTRKEHKCSACARMFPAGTKMRVITTADAGRIYSDYVCSTCTAIMNRDKIEEYCEGDLREDALEYEEELKSKSKEIKILAISGKAQRGKDTSAAFIAKELTDKGYKVLVTHYADLLKWMCKNYFNWDGNKDEAGRNLLQTVGTDIVRAQDPDFWVRWVTTVLKLFPNEWDYAIIPDCRFPNEIDFLRNNFKFVKLLRVNRPNFVSPLTVEQQNHSSETSLDDYSFDIVLENTTLDKLQEQIKNLCDKLEEE